MVVVVVRSEQIWYIVLEADMTELASNFNKFVSKMLLISGNRKYNVNSLQKTKTTFRLTQMKSVMEVGFRQGLVRALALLFYHSQSCPISSRFIYMLTSRMVMRGLQEQDTCSIARWLHSPRGGEASNIFNNYKTKILISGLTESSMNKSCCQKNGSDSCLNIPAVLLLPID